MNELTVGTLVEVSDIVAEPLPEGWVEIDCPSCQKLMRCQEKNVKPKREGDTVTLICYKCLLEQM